MKVRDVLDHSNATITTISGGKKYNYERLYCVRYDMIGYENEINDTIPVVTSKIQVPTNILNLTVDFIAPIDSGRIVIYTK